VRVLCVCICVSVCVFLRVQVRPCCARARVGTTPMQRT